MKNLHLPPGFRFKPNDAELINDYLKPKVMGQKLPCSIIKNEIELYGPNSTPWELFDVYDPDSWVVSIQIPTEKSLYVFANLSKVSTDPNNIRMKSRFNTNKKAGCGTWSQKTPRKLITDRDGNVIGGKRMLVFVVNDVGLQFDHNKAVYFKMHEYSLWGINQGLGSHIVLCQISVDISRLSSFKLATEKTDRVSRKGSKVPKKTQNRKILETSVTMSSDVLQEGRSSESLVTSKSVAVMSTNVLHDYRSSESLVEMDGGVGTGADLYNFGVQDFNFGGDLYFDDLGGEALPLDDEEFSLESFDIAGFMRDLDSNQEEDSFEDRAFGKRKLEDGDNSGQTKKSCV